MKFLASHWFETIMDQSLVHYLSGGGGEERICGGSHGFQVKRGGNQSSVT